MSQFCIKIGVPTEAVPALIGFQGIKPQDTECRTLTKIKFFTTSDLISEVLICGQPENCKMAEKIINLAVIHFLAATSELSGHKETLGPSSAAQDIRTIFHELLKYKA